MIIGKDTYIDDSVVEHEIELLLKARLAEHEHDNGGDNGYQHIVRDVSGVPFAAMRSLAVPDAIADKLMQEHDTPSCKDDVKPDGEQWHADSPDGEKATPRCLYDMLASQVQIMCNNSRSNPATFTYRSFLQALSDALRSMGEWDADADCSIVTPMLHVLGSDVSSQVDASRYAEVMKWWNVIPLIVLLNMKTDIGRRELEKHDGRTYMHERLVEAPVISTCIDALRSASSSFAYPDWAYYGEHERPHIARYDDDWENGQQLSIDLMLMGLHDERTDEHGNRSYAPRKRRDLSCAWCAWIDDVRYAEDTLVLMDRALVSKEFRQLLYDIDGQPMQRLLDAFLISWDWIGWHLPDLMAS
jgi:hypothetical protein